MNSVLLLRVGDTLPVFDATITDEAGTPVDLTGATVTLELTPFDAAGDMVPLTCSIVGAATAGRVRYAWQAGDTDTAVHYRGHLRCVFAGGGERLVPTAGFLTVWIRP